MIGVAPFGTRIGRSGKYSSRQTGGDGYQKYAHHFGDPWFPRAWRRRLRENGSVAASSLETPPALQGDCINQSALL
jgi:hypothetical protein